jgi:hypothetical protein
MTRWSGNAPRPVVESLECFYDPPPRFNTSLMRVGAIPYGDVSISTSKPDKARRTRREIAVNVVIVRVYLKNPGLHV